MRGIADVLNPHRRPRISRRSCRVHLAPIVLHILLFICVSTSLAQESNQEVYRQTRAWLEFNHHVGGIIVLVLAALTGLEVLESNASKLIRLGWPICLIVIGCYNLILSDRLTWPITASEVIESLSNPEIFQHKILAVMVLMLGLIELLRRLQLATRTAWLYLFYGLALFTGGILMAHDLGAPHAHFDGLTTSHILMGLLALFALVLKVLVDHRLILGKVAYLYPLTLAGLGIQLLLFTEPSTMAK